MIREKRGNNCTKGGIPQRLRQKEPQGKSETGLKREREKGGEKEPRRMKAEFLADEDGALALGSEMGSAIMSPWGSVSKKALCKSTK
jgi:hypothetical protein